MDEILFKETARRTRGLGKGHNKKRPLEDSITQKGNEMIDWFNRCF